MKILKFISATLAASLLFAGCGGSGNTISGIPPGGSSGGTTVTVATVHVVGSPATVAADGSTTSAIVATVLDANNAGVANAAVTFGASAGGAIAVTSGTTDASGTATATLSNVSGAAGTNLTVTATAGGVQGTATIGVVALQQSISMETDLPQVPSDASKAANISALLRDANNNALAGVTVTFSATSGVLTVTQAVTDATGTAKATLTSGVDPTNRTITVTASAGSATATLSESVTGTSMALSGPSNLVLNSSGSASVVLTNSSGAGIPNATVTLSSANGNTLSAMSLITDASGRANFTITGTTGGNDTITATADGLIKTLAVAVSTQNFAITTPAASTTPTKVNIGTPQTVTATWLNNGAPVVGQPVTFAATRGTLNPTTAVNTDASGNASVAVTSTGAGPSIVSASGNGVSAQVSLDFIALTATQISVQASPASVPVQQTSQITAVVRDAANNLVEGKTVDFVVTNDPTNGGLSVASAVTDVQGRASTVYTAGNSSSGANGVTVTATVEGASPAVTGTTQLTVGGQAVFLSLGTGNTLDGTVNPAIYVMPYSVFAVDSQGAALPNVPITLSVLPVAYGKGVMAGCVAGAGPGWSPAYSTATSDLDAYAGETMCKNEDTDYTGNINSLPGKDYNNNGRLDPGNVAVVSPSSGVTDATGRLDVKVTWPRDHSYWVQVTLVATTTVQGTQSSTSSTFILPGLVGDYACNTAPPGPVSPYGTAATCANPN